MISPVPFDVIFFVVPFIISPVVVMESIVAVTLAPAVKNRDKNGSMKTFYKFYIITIFAIISTLYAIMFAICALARSFNNPTPTVQSGAQVSKNSSK